MRLVLFLLAGMLSLILACTGQGKSSDEKPIARVHDRYLYPSDLSGQMPSGIGQEDSIRISRRYIEEWVMEQLLLKQAETQLPEEDKDVMDQVENYRSSLLIFKYKQKLLQGNIDSLISDDEIRQYYEENSSNYILESDVVQVSYLKIPVSAPRINEARRWYRSDRPENEELLREYAAEYADFYAIKDSTWLVFTDLIGGLPLNIQDPARYLNYNRFIESRDNDFQYFIRILDRIRGGEIKPLSMVDENIRAVLLNKRKLEYIQDLENTVFKEGFSRSQAEIY